VICLEIKRYRFNAEKLVRSFKVSAKNSLTLSLFSLFYYVFIDVILF